MRLTKFPDLVPEILVHKSRRNKGKERRVKRYQSAVNMLRANPGNAATGSGFSWINTHRRQQLGCWGRCGPCWHSAAAHGIKLTGANVCVSQSYVNTEVTVCPKLSRSYRIPFSFFSPPFPPEKEKRQGRLILRESTKRSWPYSLTEKHSCTLPLFKMLSHTLSLNCVKLKWSPPKLFT